MEGGPTGTGALVVLLVAEASQRECGIARIRHLHLVERPVQALVTTLLFAMHKIAQASVLYSSKHVHRPIEGSGPMLTLNSDKVEGKIGQGEEAIRMDKGILKE